jgi:hypothetical protein
MIGRWLPVYISLFLAISSCQWQRISSGVYRNHHHPLLSGDTAWPNLNLWILKIRRACQDHRSA